MLITDQQQEASKSLFDRASELFFEAIKAQLKCTFSSICSDPETIRFVSGTCSGKNLEHDRRPSLSFSVNALSLVQLMALNELKDVGN